MDRGLIILSSWIDIRAQCESELPVPVINNVGHRFEFTLTSRYLDSGTHVYCKDEKTSAQAVSQIYIITQVMHILAKKYGFCSN